MNNVNYYFKGASNKVAKKPYFNQLNYVLPWLKIVNVQASQVECGSAVSNNVALNKITSDPTEKVFGYPFKDEKCYSSYVRGKLDKKPIPDGLNPDGS